MLRPTSRRALVMIHLAYTYGGCLYMYMGYISFEPFLFGVIGWHCASVFFIAVGFLTTIASLFGVHASIHRTRNTLHVHLKVLKALCIILVLQMGVGIYYTSESLTIESRVHRLTMEYISTRCPDILGYTCHGTPNYFLQNSTILSSQYRIGLIPDSMIDAHRNKTLVNALTIPDDPYAPLTKLCDTLSIRMNTLGGDLAMNLNTTCSLCGTIPPKRTKPRWAIDSSWQNPDILPYICQYYLFPQRWKFMRCNRYFNEYTPLSNPYNYFGDRFRLLIRSVLQPFAGVIARSSGLFAMTVVALIYEIHRTFSESAHHLN